MIGRRFVQPFVAGVMVLALSPLCSATVVPVSRSARPLPQRQVRSAAVPPALQWHAVRPGSHVFFGTVAAIRGSAVSVRLRNGRVLNVDAAAAIAHGDYSAPLFVGKYVSVDGEQRNGTFTAAHIFRLSDLRQLPADR